jgi:hypothetical protein
MGYSVGRWEGDEFVVETAGFNDQVWNIDLAGHPHSDVERVIERFRRVSYGYMDFQVTIDDPKTYAKPWVMPLMKYTMHARYRSAGICLREEYLRNTWWENKMIRFRPSAIFLAAAGLLAGAAPLAAHHSFAAEYDPKKQVELKGTLTSIEWVNPHAWIHMDVADAGGKVTKWDCELCSPNILMRNGWRKDSLKPGDAILVSGSAAKDDSHMANARTVKLADGTRVFNAGSSGEADTQGAPTQYPLRNVNCAPAEPLHWCV